MTDRKADVAAIMDGLALLNQDELSVLLIIVQRLIAGAPIYGSLDIENDTRNFAQEAMEEQVDGAIYSSIELLRVQRRKDNNV
jgi:hypothetical protein